MQDQLSTRFLAVVRPIMIWMGYREVGFIKDFLTYEPTPRLRHRFVRGYDRLIELTNQYATKQLVHMTITEEDFDGKSYTTTPVVENVWAENGFVWVRYIWKNVTPNRDMRSDYRIVDLNPSKNPDAPVVLTLH